MVRTRKTSIHSILSYLNKNPHITRVDLSDRELTDSDAIVLCHYLNTHPQIKAIDLSNNEIGAKGMSALADNTTLEVLKINNNPGFNPMICHGQWFISILHTFFPNKFTSEGYCSGMSTYVLRHYIKSNSQPSFIRFNIKIIKLHELYMNLRNYTLNQDFLDEPLSEKEETMTLAAEKFLEASSEDEKNEINKLLAFLKKIAHLQKYQSSAREVFNKKATTYFALKKVNSADNLSLRLEKLRQRALKRNVNFGLYCSTINPNHATSLGYNSTLDTWVYCDANRLPIKYFPGAELNDVAEHVFEGHRFNNNKSKDFPLRVDACFESKMSTPSKAVFSEWPKSKKIHPNRLGLKEARQASSQGRYALLSLSIGYAAISIALLITAISIPSLLPILALPVLAAMTLAPTAGLILTAGIINIFRNNKKDNKNDSTRVQPNQLIEEPISSSNAVAKNSHPNQTRLQPQIALTNRSMFFEDSRPLIRTYTSTTSTSIRRGSSPLGHSTM